MPTAPVSPPTDDAVRAALSGVIDPELGDNVVDLGMVRRVEVGPDGAVDVTVALTTAGCPLRAQLMRDVKSRVGAVTGVSDVRVKFGEMT
ncbi:MAG TPA: metal-sulfur cluster assembly factor, partial [Acidimicrobiales bacterium]|nr:metal-sulfur cluster assembly factor [Acidimicrobiales bacterium]